jgi:hypothetical protein
MFLLDHAFQPSDHGDLFAIEPPLVTNAGLPAKVKWRPAAGNQNKRY